MATAKFYGADQSALKVHVRSAARLASAQARAANVRALCDAQVVPGDQLEASSPADATFWPLHPTMERLWARAKLARACDAGGEAWFDASRGPDAQTCTAGCKLPRTPGDVSRL